MDETLIKLSAEDRCDRCGAQAYVLAEHEDMPTELLFCKHHVKEFGAGLLSDGWTLREDYESYADQMDSNRTKV